MTTRLIVLAAAAVLVTACTDIVSRDGRQIAIAIPSAYKLDTAKLRADRYCERHYDSRSELVRTESLGRSDVAYFACR
jgi:hypothetical protein